MTIPTANVLEHQYANHRFFPMMSRVRELLWHEPDMTIESPQKVTEERSANPQLEEKQLPEFTLRQVSRHNSRRDCWIVIFDKVYDVTNFLNEHPGGAYIIMESAGRDATIPFRGSRHGKDSYQLLAKYLIGILPENERMYSWLS